MNTPQPDLEVAQAAPPWTLKCIPAGTRTAAIAAAQKRRVRIGQWVTEAIDAHAAKSSQEHTAAVAGERSDTLAPPTDNDPVDALLKVAEQLNRFPFQIDLKTPTYVISVTAVAAPQIDSTSGCNAPGLPSGADR